MALVRQELCSLLLPHFISLPLTLIPTRPLERRNLSSPAALDPVNYQLRYLVLRFSFFVLLIATISGPATGSAQESSSSQPDQQPAEVAPVQPAAPEPPSEQVLAAEAAISKADWKAAEEKLNPWLAAHTDDARALFDAGYVADAQNREEDAAGFYRRAVQSNPSSFEAHLSLGLLLARLHQPGEAREQLMAATRLDPGEAGPALKARAWRALARIDMDRTTGQADLAAA